MRQREYGAESGMDLCQYAYTGGEQTFTVPAGASNVQVVAVGAPGGGMVAPIDGDGGQGSSVSASLSVTASETLYVEVGGPGRTGTEVLSNQPQMTIPTVSAFNGGGQSTGGSLGRGGDDPYLVVAGGGGASDVQTESVGAVSSADPNGADWSSSLGSRLVVAAGGGGGGGVGFSSINSNSQAVAGGTGGAGDHPGGAGAATRYSTSSTGPITGYAGGAGGGAGAGASGQGAAGDGYFQGSGGYPYDLGAGGGGYDGGGAGGAGSGPTGNAAVYGGGGGGGGGTSYANGAATSGTPTALTTPPSVTISWAATATASLDGYSNGTDHWATTNPGEVPGGYTDAGTLGYLLTASTSGAVPLYSCENTQADAGNYLSTDSACEATATYSPKVVGTEGYLYTSPPSGVATVALYRCFDPTLGDYLETTAAPQQVGNGPVQCGEDPGTYTEQELLGYVVTTPGPLPAVPSVLPEAPLALALPLLGGAAMVRRLRRRQRAQPS